MGWQARGSLSSQGSLVMAHNAYGDTMDDVAPVEDDRAVSGLVEDNGDWNLGEIPISRREKVCTSLRADFTIIQTQWHS